MQMLVTHFCRLLEGGADTGFHHVEPESYTPRLMHFSGAGRNVVIRQVRTVLYSKPLLNWKIIAAMSKQWQWHADIFTDEKRPDVFVTSVKVFSVVSSLGYKLIL